MNINSDKKNFKGFIPIPSFFAIAPQNRQESKPISIIPSYPLECYIPGSKIEGDSLYHFDFQTLKTEVVLFKVHGWDIEIGTVVAFEEGNLHILCIEKNSKHSVISSLKSLEWIAPVTFDRSLAEDKEPLLTTFDVLNWLGACVLKGKIEGSSVSLDILNLSLSKARMKDEGQILSLIASPLKRRRPEKTINGLSSTIFDRSTALGASLSWRLDHHMIDRHYNIYNIMAKGYIRSYKETLPEQIDLAFLNDLDTKALLAFYQKGEWPVTKLELEVSDSAWAAHLEGCIPFACNYEYYGTVKDCEEGVIVWSSEEQERVRKPDYPILSSLLFNILKKGEYPLDDEDEFIMYLKEAVKMGDAPSMIRLGRCYQLGWCVDQDNLKALDLYEQAYNIDQSITSLRGMLQVDFQNHFRHFTDHQIREWLSDIEQYKPKEETVPPEDYWDSEANALQELKLLKGQFLLEGYGLEKDLSEANRIFYEMKYLGIGDGNIFKKLSEKYLVTFEINDVSSFENDMRSKVLDLYYAKEILDDRFKVPPAYLNYIANVKEIYKKGWLYVSGSTEAISNTQGCFKFHNCQIGSVDIIMINVGWWSDKHDYWLSCDTKYSFGKVFDCYDINVSELNEGSADELWDSWEDFLMKL
ncbi:tetratricopeptide repeat protein [Spirochaeta cellobiosiphila]|uniref:tetratricopeptide repeat protein n=1 Tax=Spirochaeta cellobiosiphila TaxID=504483 RepID=UPI00040A9758|nr:SEL1-like repeat protein [Spirochaeta cellobiosiphila]